MKQMPKPNHSDDTQVSSNSSLGEGAQAPESGKTLHVPTHESEESQPENPVISKPSDKIEVVATRKGFYGQMRKRKGDKFHIEGFQQVGDWMECIDPALEKKRRELLKFKKVEMKKELTEYEMKVAELNKSMKVGV